MVLNEGRKRIRLRVTSKGDRPIQVSWNDHERDGGANGGIDWEPLPFHRDEPAARVRPYQAYGYRLDIAAGTSVRFEPGDTKTVTLVQIGGEKVDPRWKPHGNGPPSIILTSTKS